MSLSSRAGRRQILARRSHAAGLLPVLRQLRSAFRHDLRILAYHRVLDSADPKGFSFDTELISATGEQFREQMRSIKRDFHPMRFDQVLSCIDANRRLPKGAILVTFDDGYDDNYRIAYPILRELGMSAMFFVSTGHIDSGMPYAYDWLVHMICTTSAPKLLAPELGIDWDVPDRGVADALTERRALAARLLDQLKSLDDAGQEALISRLEREWAIPRSEGHPDCRPMSWEQLREMRQGGMEIGSHGVGHRMLAKLPRDQMSDEVNGSKRALERELGAPAQVLSYPVGGPDAFDAETIEVARSAGFRMACSYMAGTSPIGPDSRYCMRRLPVESEMDAAWFSAMVSLPEMFSYSSRLRIG
ncbi:MAG: polysaccharide deacetylase family protein [Pseudoxanthomonas sp.]